MSEVVKNRPLTATSRTRTALARPKSKLIGKAAIWIFTLGLIGTPSLLHSQAGIGFSPILSGSMRPAANPGDVFLTKVVNASTLRVGDIITVHNQVTGTFYAHRIAEIRTANSVLRILTKGDSNPTIDQDPYLISPKGKVSKEFFVVPLVGRPMVYAASFQGRQAATTLLVTSNVLGIFLLLFRKKIKTNFGSERVYKELYSDERTTSEHYRNLIDHLKIIEMERNLMNNESWRK
jgi:signal peptidase I